MTVTRLKVKKVKKEYLVCLIIFVVLVAGGFTVRYAYDYFNISKVSYNGRLYNKSSRGMDATFANAFGATSPTGVFTKGMEVYDADSSPHTSPVIFLRQSDGNFLPYVLVGGP